jgi:arylsulfatase A-like enzyme
MRSHPDDLMGLYEDCQFESCPQEPRHPDSYCGNLEAEQGFSDPRANLQGYFAAISGMDRAIGQVLAGLDAHGIRDNTLVVFISDNGMNCGHHGVWGKGNGTFPQNMYDSSVKVPLIVSHPGRVAVARTTECLGSGYDILPTLLDYLGMPMDMCASLPGRSLRGIFEGQDTSPVDEVVVYDEYGPVRMIRDAQWKYVHRYPYGPHLLFNMKTDPDERVNLVDEPEHSELVAQMRARLQLWFATHSDPLNDGAHQANWGRGQLGPVGIAGKGRPAFAEKAPSGAYARRTYGDFVDVAEANRKPPMQP